MGKTVQLRKKSGYWATHTGGKTKYFGKVEEVPYEDAMRRFREYLVAEELAVIKDTAPVYSLTVDQLADQFLEWVLMHRGEKAHGERARHIRRFQESCGSIPAILLRGSHLEDFIDILRLAGHAPDYIQKHVISVRAMINKGVKRGWLPPDFLPFASVEPLRQQKKVLTENALMTDDEVRDLFASADEDVYKQMGDILRVYHATGARTAELMSARVGDFQRSTRQIVLGTHKRSHTMKNPVTRSIALNPVAYEIIERRCADRSENCHIFTRPTGAVPYSNVNIAEKFQTVRKRAGVRPEVTIYSFRHLWISEMLMAGVDVLRIARMAGTSVMMIERVYGHFRTQSFQDAQETLDRNRSLRGL